MSHAVDQMVERADADYDGELDYQSFVKFMEELDPELMADNAPH